MFGNSELLDFISDITGNNDATAVLYFLVDDGGTEKVKIVNITNDTQSEIFAKYLPVVNSKLSMFERDDFEIKNINDYNSARGNINYYFDFSQLTPELQFLTNISLRNDDLYTAGSEDILKGVIIKIHTANDQFDIFIPHYAVQSLTRDRTMLIIPDNRQFKSLDADNVIRFGFNIFLISYHGKVLCFDFKKMENKYGYNAELERKASEKIQKISDSNLIDDIQFLSELIGTEKAVRNKILRIADDSRVFIIGLNRIRTFVTSRPRFAFQYGTTGRFIIDNKNQAKNFLTVLNDDILKSELTEQEYEAEDKNIVR